MITPIEARDLLRHADDATVLTFLRDLTPADRKVVGVLARGWLTKLHDPLVPRGREFLAAAAGAQGVRQFLQALDHSYLGENRLAEVLDQLVERQPSWVADVAAACGSRRGHTEWAVAHRLVTAGLAPVPEHPEYLLGMAHGHSPRLGGAGSPGRTPPAWVEDVMRMLGTEGAGRRLTNRDGWLRRPQHAVPSPVGELSWSEALVGLTVSGELGRDRLLDRALASLLQDWAPVDQAFFVILHDALDPTLTEVAERWLTYTSLLGGGHGPTVRLAQRRIQLALGSEPAEVDLAVLVESSTVALVRPDKGSAIAQLRLLERVAELRPDLALDAVVGHATDHPHADVRERARRLLERRGEVVAASPTVAWSEPEPVAADPPGAVAPVASVDELADLLLALMEDVDAIDLERAVDGLLRFGRDVPTSAAPVLARAEACPFYEGDPRCTVAALTRAWLGDAPSSEDRRSLQLAHSIMGRPAGPSTVLGILGQRFADVADRTGSRPRASLTLPTNDDGALSSVVLGARLREVGRWSRTDRVEVGLALLRAEPQDREGVHLPRSLRRDRSLGRLVRDGAEPWTRRVSRPPRRSWEKPVAVVLFHRGGHGEEDVLDWLSARRDPEPGVLEELEHGLYLPAFEQTLAVVAATYPHDPDVLAAHVHPFLHRDLTANLSVSTAVLEALGRCDVPLGAPGSSALVLAMAAKDGRGRTAAQDAIIERAARGRLDGAALGRQAVLLLQDDIVVGSRVVTSLRDAAQASDAAVLPLLDALRELLPSVVDRHDAAAWVTLAADLRERGGRSVPVPDVLQVLASGISRSALAKAARRLS